MPKFYKKKVEEKPVRKSRFAWKLKAIVYLLVLLCFLVGTYSVVRAVNTFFNEYYLHFNQVIEVVLRQPVEIRKREPRLIEVLLDYPDEIDTPLKEYICQKFGNYECKPALAVASAESGLREDAYHINSDGTIDIGVFQINEAHWEKPGCSPKELFDAESNVDCAYTIWQASGWNPWVVYKSGSYIKHLE